MKNSDACHATRAGVQPPRWILAAVATLSVLWVPAGAGAQVTTTLVVVTTTTIPVTTTTMEPVPCEVPPGADLVVTDLTDGLTAADLAAALVGSGVAISNVNLTGGNVAAGTFVDGSLVTGIPTGVILSSGCAKAVADPNDVDNYTYVLGAPGDTDLDALIPGYFTQDATVLEFDFVPETDTLQVRYVFSSEEYNEFVNSSFNDVFAFFVNGVNRALLPDNTTVVAINNVNGGNPFGTNSSHPAFYRNNDPNDPAATLDIEADGLTIELRLTAMVAMGQTNHFKVAIADAGDEALDSWIFLQSGSFSSVENCSNQVDDDGDDLVDNADPDCWSCGDGNLDPGETCDDGNILPGDGCDPLCNDEENCGNGQLEEGEECDDGNTLSGDGCDAQCNAEALCGNGCVENGEECDDGSTVAGDGCDDRCEVETCYRCEETTPTTTLPPGGGAPCVGPSVCTPDDGASCDDGDECTVRDGCSAGLCLGGEVLIPAACKWAVVGGDPARRVRARTRAHAEVVGRVCADEVFIGEESETRQIVGMLATGNAIRISRAPLITGDVVTDGGAVFGKPNGTPLPGLATDTVAGGTVVAKDPTSNYDTTGSHALTGECDVAQADIDIAVPLLDGLPPTADLGNVQIGGQGSLTIAPGSPTGVVAGGVNVIDIGRFRTGNNVTVTLDGGGNAATVYILRVNRKFDLHFKGDIVLTNGQSAANVIIYGRSSCKFGEETTGAGTVICPEGKLFLEERATWNGALLGGKQRIEVRDSAVLTHVPLQIGL